MNNNDIYASLDIGTSSVKVIIAEVANNNLNIIGAVNVHSEGLKKGVIVDIDKTVHSIRKAIDQAERMVNMPIENVIVGLNGSHVSMIKAHGVVAVSSQGNEIDDTDIERVIDAASVISLGPDRAIIDIIPSQFIVDGVGEIKDPRGLVGTRLEMYGTIVTCSKTVYQNLAKCISRAGLNIAATILQPMASGNYILSEDEKEFGVALVDIGGGSTTVTVFKEGVIVGSTIIPLGGENLTNDISYCFKTSKEEAEKIKLEYGCAFYNYASEDIIFTLPKIGNNEQVSHTQLELADVMEARLEEIFELIAMEIAKMGVKDLPGGFVLTGGVAATPNILELVKDMFDSNIRIFVPSFIGTRDPAYTCSIGIITFAYKNAKLTGVPLSPIVSSTYRQVVNETKEKKLIQKNTNQKNKAKKDPEEKGTFKKFLGYFFE